MRRVPDRSFFGFGNTWWWPSWAITLPEANQTIGCTSIGGAKKHCHKLPRCPKKLLLLDLQDDYKGYIQFMIPRITVAATFVYSNGIRIGCRKIHLTQDPKKFLFPYEQALIQIKIILDEGVSSFVEAQHGNFFTFKLTSDLTGFKYYWKAFASQFGQLTAPS